MSEFLPSNLQPIHEVAQMAAASRLYGLQPEQAFVQLLVARDLGIPATSALSNIHVVKGKPVISGNLMRALVKASGRYDYRVLHSDAQRCEIQWIQGGEPLGTSSFTMEQAKRAGLTRNPTWTSYPEAMLLARATAVGVRMHCPDVLMGSVYVEGELDQAEPVQAEVVEVVAQTTSAPAQRVEVTLEDQQGQPVAPAPSDPLKPLRNQIRSMIDELPEGAIRKRAQDGLVKLASDAGGLEQLRRWVDSQVTAAAAKEAAQ